MTSAVHRQTSAWSPLQHSLFRSLWIAGLIANSALGMQGVGAAWMMTSLDASPLMVALVQTATALPAFLFNLPGGVLADQVDRRSWLLFTQGWMLLSAAVLSILLLYDLVGPWVLLSLTFALGIGNALNLSAWSATVADVVPREEVPSAIALNGVSYNLARVLGPAFAGGVIGWLGVTAVFMLNAICFAMVVVILFNWRGVPRVPSSLPPEGLLGGMRSGLRYARHSAAARIVLLRTVLFALCASSLWALLPLVARDQLKLEASGFGMLLGSLGCGAVLCAFLLPRLRARFALNTLVSVSSLAFAACIVATALIDDYLLVCLTLLLGGVAWMAGNATTGAVLQTSLPTWVRARVVSVYLLAFQGAMAIGGALWGALATQISVPETLIVSAVLLSGGVLLIWRKTLQMGSAEEATLWQAGQDNPPIYIEVGHREGPVAVQLDYRIKEQCRDQFVQAAHALGVSRKRNGARGWRLYRDMSDPLGYSERFVVASWGDYLRQQARCTLADRALEECLQEFIAADSPVSIRHFIAAAPTQALNRQAPLSYSPPDQT